MLKFNGVEVLNVLRNGQPLDILKYQGVIVWENWKLKTGNLYIMNSSEQDGFKVVNGNCVDDRKLYRAFDNNNDTRVVNKGYGVDISIDFPKNIRAKKVKFSVDGNTSNKQFRVWIYGKLPNGEFVTLYDNGALNKDGYGIRTVNVAEQYQKTEIKGIKIVTSGFSSYENYVMQCQVVEWEEKPSVPSLPYIIKEWIQSDGVAFIDTLIRPNQNTDIKITFSLDSIEKEGAVYGAFSPSPKQDNRYQMVFSRDSQTYIGYGKDNIILPTNNFVGSKHTLIIDSKAKTISLDGTIIKSNIAPADLVNDNSNTMYLWSTHQGSISTAVSKIKIYECEVGDNSNKIMLKPCLFDGVACMVDTLTNTPYRTTAGTFTVGDSHSAATLEMLYNDKPNSEETVI